MSRLGPLSYGSEEGSVFLGKDYTQRSQDYSEQTAREIDQEVRRLVDEQYDKVKTLLSDKKDRLEAIAKALLEHETLDAEDLKAIFESRELAPRTRIIIPTYADKEKAKQEKRKAASIFGGPPKPATS
jgi:cell division protease FtsH